MHTKDLLDKHQKKGAAAGGGLIHPGGHHHHHDSPHQISDEIHKSQKASQKGKMREHLEMRVFIYSFVLCRSLSVRICNILDAAMINRVCRCFARIVILCLLTYALYDK